MVTFLVLNRVWNQGRSQAIGSPIGERPVSGCGFQLGESKRPTGWLRSLVPRNLFASEDSSIANKADGGKERASLSRLC